MRRSIWTRVLAVVLIISMLTVPVSASGWNSKSSWGSSWGSIWDSIWDKWFGGGSSVGEPAPTDPTDPADPSEPVDSEAVLTLVEDASTVDNGALLRASTYALTTEEDSAAANAASVNAYSVMATADEPAAQADGTTVKYFPVTMYDYNTATINAATEKKDGGTGELQGMYFSGGSPTPKTVEAPNDLTAGQYYIQNVRAAANRTDGASWLQAHADNKIYAVTQAEATRWTLTIENGSYYLTCQIDGVTNYMKVGTNGENDGYTTEKTPIDIVASNNRTYGQNSVQLRQNGYYLCQWGGVDVQDFGGYNVNDDDGNPMRLYAVDADGNVSDTPTPLYKAKAHNDLTWAQVQAGTYYADEACTNKATVNQIGETSEDYTDVSVTADTIWNEAGGTTSGTWYATSYYHYYYNAYRPVYIMIPTGASYYQVGYDYYGTGNSIWNLGYYGGSDSISLYKNASTVTGYTLTAGGSTLATLDGTDTSQKVGVTLYTPGTSDTITRAYAAWNHWNKGSGDNANGDLIYTGLVQSQMVDDQIVFNVPEGGIFNNDTSVKAIYEYVGLPFVLKEGGVYSFDSDENGAYFADTDGDGDADPQSGSIDGSGNITAYNLKFDEGNTQPLNITVGDGSTNAFFPYNIYTTDSWGSKTYNQDIDYHFGMRADLPFSMTPNGRILSTDDESTPITFTFSGDDDVWVFIDGHLVIDLGGIHNRLDATIDFAHNTITYSEENAQDDNKTTASYNDADFSMTQQLFTTDSGTGVIPMTRDAFALDPDHEMQVFYLERGEGTSNCRIEFNLPMNDTVLVTKDATKSWSQAAEDADLEEDPDMVDPGVDMLTATEQAIVNNIDFGFTLYKKEAGAETASPVANTNFYLIGRDVEGTVVRQTDADGHFYLKNGQSAKFITELPTAGVTYYVVEDQVPDGFISPDFNFAGEATYNYSYTDGTESGSGTASAKDASEIPEQIIPMPTKNEDGSLTWAQNKSYEVTVSGSIEANDSIEFICSNYLDAELPNPTALTYEDIIVIDYGLPVQIDPLHNDVFRGDDIEIVYFGDDSVTLTETVGADNVVNGSWSGTKNFHSGNVVLNDVTYAVDDEGNVTRDTFTYTLNKQLTEVEVLTYIIKVTGQEQQEATHVTLTQNDYAIGKVYIVPATVMYYEEDFSNLVTFKGSNWVGPVTTNGASAYQEPGVVGTTTDSIYGSDVAYLNDSYDSNGTSRYGDTTKGAIQFSYTFTGTGTSVFARTSATTGYVQFKLYKGTDTSGDYMKISYRDTYYKDENHTDEDAAGTLYNIPIYTQEDLDYGTYTLVATVAKAGTKTTGNVNGSGKDFYLDGIRIMQPLHEGITSYEEDGTPNYDEITTKALGAYATDGESNIETVTLRQKLITDNEVAFDPDEGETEEKWPFVVMTDIDGEIVYASDYVSIGPKEEVYLYPGQSVSFAIKYWHTDGYRMHMGMKAPFGTATVQVGQTTFNLNNAADCYYDITGLQASVVTETDEDGNTYYVATYTFKATDKIVSLTNIKVTGNYEFTIVENTDEDVNGDTYE